jgi:phage recombination protein Bet
MNAIAKVENPKPMLLEFMADKYGLRPQEFADTVRKTCGLATASAEEFAAFVMVAREYDLNPMLREIYAFPKRGGGIVPIVSIDGWVNLVNSHPACDGFEFDIEHDDKNELVSITCRMYRKDRNRPVVVTEYYSECKRETDPWKMKHRMLRHKAMIQAARYAFGFSGIYDEDEGAKIAEMRDVTPPTPPKPPAPPSAQIVHDADTGEVIDDAEIVRETGEQIAALLDDVEDDTDFFTSLDAAMDEASDAASIEEIWSEYDPMARFENNDDGQALALSIKRRHDARVGGR